VYVAVGEYEFFVKKVWLVSVELIGRLGKYAFPISKEKMTFLATTPTWLGRRPTTLSLSFLVMSACF
jgi:hypothetical protein